jgi:hypothetical protein
MLRGILFFSFALAIASGGPIGVGPIPVSGGGTYSQSFGDAGITEFFSGNNGTDGVSFSGGGEAGPRGGIGYGTGPGVFDADGISGASIDGTSSKYFTFNVGGGGGSMTLYDSLNNVIATANLQGYIVITGITYENPAVPLLGYTETFLITPTPEPGTSWMMLVGLAAMAVAARRRLGQLEDFSFFSRSSRTRHSA